MSYEARGEGSLIIKKESFDKLTQAVLSHLGGSAPESIEDLFENHGFEIEFDNEGNISGAEFPMAAARMATSFLDVIEPYIEEGTEMEFEAEDGDCWTWPTKKTDEDGIKPYEAGFEIFFNIEDFEEIKSSIIEWINEKGYELPVSEEADISTLFTALGFPEVTVNDDDTFFLFAEDVSCEQLAFPYLEFLKVIGSYASSEDLGYIDTEDEGRMNVTYGYDGELEFESAW
ncbi:MAG: hypothetical protein IKH81_00915 [Clostridia bacterium]|nr:hypothetical protein [Clostridia bacterium]